MAKYTMQVRDICESMLERTEYAEFSEVNDIIDDTYMDIFEHSYTILSNPYHSEESDYTNKLFVSAFFIGDSAIAKKVLKYYYLREIGAETAGLWKSWMNKRVINIAPKYEAWLIKNLEGDLGTDIELRELLDIVKLKVYNNEETYTISNSESRSTSESASGTVDNDSRATEVNNKSANEKTATDLYPQTNLSGAEDYMAIAEKSSASENSNNSDTRTYDESYTRTKGRSNSLTDTGSEENEHDYDRAIYGMKGDYEEMIKRYKKSVVDVEKLIIDEFADLFLNLW